MTIPPPTVFNVVIDAVIRHWVTMVVPTEERTEGPRETIQELSTFFYAYGSLVALNHPERL